MNRDPIPHKDADFNNFVLPFNSQVQANHTATPTWMGLTNGQVTDLDTAVTAWADAYAATLNPATATAPDTLAKNEARAALEARLRPLLRQLQANPAMTDDIRADLGLHLPSQGHSRAPVPASAPVLSVDVSQRLQHAISFRDAAAPTSKAKPAGVTACNIYAKIGLPAPTDVSQMQLLGAATHAPFVQHYDGSQAGLTVTLWACWVNAYGEPGPWSAAVSATIPG